MQRQLFFRNVSQNTPLRTLRPAAQAKRNTGDGVQGELRAARSSFAKQMGAVNITLLCRELLQAAQDLDGPPRVLAEDELT